MSTKQMSRSEQIDKVIELIGEGNSERSACEQVGIARATFRTTALRDQAGDQYARALFGLAQDQVEKIEVVLEELRNGDIDPQTARVLADTRKWFASKFLPRQYGDKIDVTSDGKQLPAPIIDLTGLTKDSKEEQ